MIIKSNKTLDNTDILSSGQNHSLAALFEPNAIETIDFTEKRCFRSGKFVLPMEDTENTQRFLLSLIYNKFFNLTLLRQKYLDPLSINEDQPPKKGILTDSEHVSLHHEFTVLDISDNITEIATTINQYQTFIVTNPINLPFSLFLRKGANLVQIGGDPQIGRGIASAVQLNQSKFYETDEDLDDSFFI